ncbi:MAG: hypothetical protein A4E65_02333 [Syntrophorhabdus sp. PtaU1.Bin153]|nr:MAG: hypothetical protein A4E65_02333 [Syntrophorhabdus sp. PtaU1.Bin153]
MQKKWSLDRITLKKILKGALYAVAPAAAIAALNYIGSIKIDDPVLASFVAWGVPVAVNAVREWSKGE